GSDADDAAVLDRDGLRDRVLRIHGEDGGALEHEIGVQRVRHHAISGPQPKRVLNRGSQAESGRVTWPTTLAWSSHLRRRRASASQGCADHRATSSGVIVPPCRVSVCLEAGVGTAWWPGSVARGEAL